jgi:hypothetical protein
MPTNSNFMSPAQLTLDLILSSRTRREIMKKRAICMDHGCLSLDIMYSAIKRREEAFLVRKIKEGKKNM